MATEREMSAAASVAVHMGAGSEPRAADRRRRFWISWVAVFGAGGVGAGITALVISLLTACTVLHGSRRLSIVVSGLLIGCLGALLTAAHGMDRLAAVRMDSDD